MFLYADLMMRGRSPDVVSFRDESKKAAKGDRLDYSKWEDIEKSRRNFQT